MLKYIFCWQEGEHVYMVKMKFYLWKNSTVNADDLIPTNATASPDAE